LAFDRDWKWLKLCGAGFKVITDHRNLHILRIIDDYSGAIDKILYKLKKG
jgi:hypothetical protein